MNLTTRIKNIFLGLGHSVQRFPLTALLSFILMSLLITINELGIRGNYNTELYQRLAMVTALGMLLSISLQHLMETYFPEKTPFLQLVPLGIFMILYYFFFTKDLNNVQGIQFVGLLLTLIIAIFYSLRLRYKREYEAYVASVFNGLLLTVVYSGVLYVGIAAIIFTINALFDANIEGKWFYYFFLMATFVFGALMFLSKLPKKDHTFHDQPYAKSLKVLLLYIVIPLITIYTGILYVYFAKILLTQVWPRGLVSNLVLWYSVVSVGVIFFITPILSENPVAKIFRTWFPRILLPILAMMFVSIGLRINQYGFTENRYFVVLLGIWTTMIMLYFILKKELSNIFIPITLSIFMVISVFGPLSAFQVSFYSQNQRFEQILNTYNMLQEGQITPNSAVTKEDQENLTSIVQYFENRNLEKLRYIPENFTYASFEDTFGFQRTYDYYRPNDQYFYLNSEWENQGMLVRDYEYAFTVSTYQPPTVLEGFSASLSEDLTLTLKKENQILFDESLHDQLVLLAETHGFQDQKDFFSAQDNTFILENEQVALKVYIRLLSGRKPEQSTMIFDQGTLTILVHEK